MGLAELFALEVGDLVGADHDRPRVHRLHGAGLLFGKAEGRLTGRFAGERRLVDVGTHGLVGKAETVKKFAAVARARGENERRHDGNL